MMMCRRYPMAGVANFRDLGGYACDGGVTRWNVFYRSTSLHKADDEDLRMIKRLGIEAVLDLRYPHEQKERPDRKIDGIRMKSISLMGPVKVEDLRVNDTVEDTKTLIRMYRQIIFQSQDAVREAVQFLIQEEKPVLFHCAAGKDRTGVIAMLLLSSAGVADEDIIADYEMSHHLVRSFTDDCSGSHGSNMRKLLSLIKNRWGSAEGYLKDCNVPEEGLRHLREKFIVPYHIGESEGMKSEQRF